MAQKYVLVPVGKKIEDVAANPELAQQYADVQMPHDAEMEWILNDVETLIELMPEPVIEEVVELAEPEPEV